MARMIVNIFKLPSNYFGAFEFIVSSLQKSFNLFQSSEVFKVNFTVFFLATEHVPTLINVLIDDIALFVLTMSSTLVFKLRVLYEFKRF